MASGTIQHRSYSVAIVDRGGYRLLRWWLMHELISAPFREESVPYCVKHPPARLPRL